MPRIDRPESSPKIARPFKPMACDLRVWVDESVSGGEASQVSGDKPFSDPRFVTQNRPKSVNRREVLSPKING